VKVVGGVLPNVLALANDQSCARPIVCASKPGTLAPPCWPDRVVERVVVDEVVAVSRPSRPVLPSTRNDPFVVAHGLRKRRSTTCWRRRWATARIGAASAPATTRALRNDRAGKTHCASSGTQRVVRLT